MDTSVFLPSPQHTATSHQATAFTHAIGQTRPGDWAKGRATDRIDRRLAHGVLDQAISDIGQQRATIHDSGSSFDIRVVEPTSADYASAAKAEQTLGVPVNVIPVKASAYWLVKTSLAIDKAISEDGVITGVDFESNQVYVGWPAGAFNPSETADIKSRVEATLKSSLADGANAHEVALDTKSDSLVKYTNAVSSDVDVREHPQVEGGRWIQTDIPNSSLVEVCTAGYLVLGKDNGVRRFTTAGHCFVNGGVSPYYVWMRDGSYVGHRTQFWPGGWDTANFSVPDNVNASITINAQGNYRTVRGSANPYNGEELCFTGWGIQHNGGDDEKCAEQSRSANLDGKTYYCLERRTYGGDSGGPVYYIQSDGTALARGLTKDTLKVDNDWDLHAARWFNCYTRIIDAGNAGNWNVAIWK